MRKRVMIAGPFCRCPFCNWMVSTSQIYLWCSGCQVEYYKSKSGDFLVFDTELKRPEYVLPKILERGGGVAIGKSSETEEGV
jgi:hypothetical protein